MRESMTMVQEQRDIFKPIRCGVKLDKLLSSYNVKGVVKVSIGLNNKEILYCIDEPDIHYDRDVEKEALKLVDVLFSENMNIYDVYDPKKLDKLSKQYNIDYNIISSNITKIIYFIEKILSGYGDLYPLTKDKYIEEIVVNKPNSYVYIFHRHYNYTWIKTNIFLNSSKLDDIVLRLARLAGRELSIAHPYIEAPLPDGNRIAATFSNEVSRFGTSLVIRKHLNDPLTPVDLVKSKMISDLYIAYLWIMLRFRATIVIAGPTASGKTTLLQALLLLIPPRDRIVTIEDTPELNLKHHENWDSLVTRIIPGTSIGKNIDMLDLTKFALRRRPDYFIIGEVRGEEAKTLVHASASGHGVLTTFHADSAFSVIRRLKADPINIGESFLQLIWVIIVLKRVRLPNGSLARRVTEIYEVVPNESSISLLKIAEWDKRKDKLVPDSVEELVERSYRLKMLTETTFMNKTEIINTINTYREIINKCIDCSYMSFINSIRNYYLQSLLRDISNGEQDQNKAR